MRFHTLLLLLVLVAIGAFAALNWDTFITPTALSLGFTTLQLPLGLVMLGALVFVSALFLMFVVYLQTTVLLDTRRHTRELQANRTLADQAEASRFTELRNFLEAELIKQATLNAESRANIIARVDRLENDLRVSMEQSGNTLAAYIGELEDRLEKTTLPPARH